MGFLLRNDAGYPRLAIPGEKRSVFLWGMRMEKERNPPHRTPTSHPWRGTEKDPKFEKRSNSAERISGGDKGEGLGEGKYLAVEGHQAQDLRK